jgi:hypothetical protein
MGSMAVGGATRPSIAGLVVIGSDRPNAADRCTDAARDEVARIRVEPSRAGTLLAVSTAKALESVSLLYHRRPADVPEVDVVWRANLSAESFVHKSDEITVSFLGSDRRRLQPVANSRVLMMRCDAQLSRMNPRHSDVAEEIAVRSPSVRAGATETVATLVAA